MINIDPGFSLPPRFAHVLTEKQEAGVPVVGVQTQSGNIVQDPGVTESELGESITERYVEFFENVENDGWLARNAMNDLMVSLG